MKYCLGKLDASPPRGLKYGDVFNAEALPSAPASFGHENLMPGGSWFMLGNNLAGNCTTAGGCHETMLWTMEGGVPRARFTTKDALSDYSTITGYNGTEASDTGANLQDVAAYRKNIGLLDATGVRHKIQGSASLKAGDLSQLAQAAYLFGTAGVGVQLPASAEDQFYYGEAWSVVNDDTIKGGHYIPCVGRNSVGNYLFITWGRLQAATPQWVQSYMDEGLAYLSSEMLNTKGVSRESYDAAALAKYLGEL